MVEEDKAGKGEEAEAPLQVGAIKVRCAAPGRVPAPGPERGERQRGGGRRHRAHQAAKGRAVLSVVEKSVLRERRSFTTEMYRAET